MVFTCGTLEEAFSDPQKGMDALTGKTPHYLTAFFEAFPKQPSTFLRGEGKTVKEAEAACWKSYLRITACKEHIFERRGRKDGYAYCKLCEYSSMVLPPLNPCHGCKAVQYKYYGDDKHGNGFCQPCYDALPDIELSESSLRMRETLKRLKREE